MRDTFYKFTASNTDPRFKQIQVEALTVEMLAVNFTLIGGLDRLDSEWSRVKAGSEFTVIDFEKSQINRIYHKLIDAVDSSIEFDNNLELARSIVGDEFDY